MPSNAEIVQTLSKITTATITTDSDLFRFTAKAGQRLVIETMAARRGSPVDTKIEILHAGDALAGQPVERVKLRAVRDTVNTFRPINSDSNGARLNNWEEMEQNDFLYMNGEVVKLFLPPRGPDSQWDFYTLGGKRRCYFDTSPTAHALDEPCYIVEPLPPATPGTALPPPNGLPVFSLPYANDDDADRQLGSDSRLIFTAPADGDYLVRVTDTRGFGGEDFAYRLIIREAKPDFTVALVGPGAPGAPGGANPTVPAGSGAAFSVFTNRIDGFEGEIKVEITGVPPGFIVSSPLLIEAGHFEAKGTGFALQAIPDAKEAKDTKDAKEAKDAKEIKDVKTQAAAPIAPAAPATPAPPLIVVTATATIDGKPVTKAVNSLATITRGQKPALLVSMTPHPLPSAATSDPLKPMEITLVPGQMTTALLKLDRVSHKDIVSFDVDNLPHGVIVADIGLNGVLIRADENERVIFIQCAPWVADMDRLCHARTREAGNQTTLPVMIKVRRGK